MYFQLSLDSLKLAKFRAVNKRRGVLLFSLCIQILTFAKLKKIYKCVKVF